MGRLREIELAGKKYPMTFSIKAAKEVIRKYGSIEGVSAPLTEGLTEKGIDAILFLLELLIAQGAAYRRVLGQEECASITLEDLEVVLGVSDISTVQKSILEVITSGVVGEIELEDDGSKKKKATQK